MWNNIGSNQSQSPWWIFIFNEYSIFVNIFSHSLDRHNMNIHKVLCNWWNPISLVIATRRLWFLLLFFFFLLLVVVVDRRNPIGLCCWFERWFPFDSAAVGRRREAQIRRSRDDFLDRQVQRFLRTERGARQVSRTDRRLISSAGGGGGCDGRWSRRGIGCGVPLTVSPNVLSR